jgi:serine protease
MRKTTMILIAALLTIALVSLAPLNSAKTMPTTKHTMRTLTLRAVPPVHLGKVPLKAHGPATQSTPPSDGLFYGGGPIEQTPVVYIDFWCWAAYGDPSGEEAYLTSFFNGVGGSSWINSQTQYYESARGYITNPVGQLGGVWHDESCTSPPNPDTQIGSEALAAESYVGFNPDADYVIATPTGHNDAQFGIQYCAWHNSEPDGYGNTIAYTDLPYMTDAGAACGENFVNSGSAGTLDGVSIVGGHEYAEAMTDPQPSSGWVDMYGSETGDKCAWITPGTPGGSADISLPTGTFAVQTLWSNAIDGCALSG